MAGDHVSDIVWPKNMNELPKEIFVRADVFELEKERIFRGPEWHPVAHVSEVPNKGDFKTFSIGDVPLLIVRGGDDEVRVFYNACSHRSNQLETEAMGNRKKFSCPYHRWLFNQEGDLIGCPNMDEYAPGFKQEDYPLARPRTEIYWGTVFVTLNAGTPSLDDWLGEDIKPVIQEALGDSELRLLGYHKVSYQANWKTWSDNDGWHAPLLHKAFSLLNWQGGKGSQRANETGHMWFRGEVKPVGKTSLIKDTSLVSFNENDPYAGGSRLVGLWPYSGYAKHLDIINIRYAIPRGVAETEVHFAYYCKADDDEDMVRQRIRQGSNLLGPCGMVSMEDASIFHRMHIGANTPGNAVFQKGVKAFDRIETEFKQNDETGNLPRWEYYRKQMGFERAAA